MEYSVLMENNYQDDSKKLKELVDATDGFSPADIKNVITSTAKKTILNEHTIMKYSQIVYEIFLKRQSNVGTIEGAVNYLVKHKVPQRDISEVLNISIRQVRNIIQEEI